MSGKIVSLNSGPVLEQLRSGKTIGEVAKSLGISTNTFRSWTQNDPEFGEMAAAAVEEAKAAGLRRKGGRPRRGERQPVVRKERVDEELILVALSVGHPRDHAAALAGVSGLQLDRWLGEDPGLAMRVERAEAALQTKMLEAIHKASEHNWTAAAWVLERRFPETYAKRAEVSRTERIRTASTIGSEVASVVLDALAQSGLPPADQQSIRERLAGAVAQVASQAG